jgi:hypothetical protein
MDWRSEEEGEDTTSDVEMEGTEAEDAEMEEEKVWSMWDLYHGLVPRTWSKDGSTSTWIAQHMEGRFASIIEEHGHTEIWNN